MRLYFGEALVPTDKEKLDNEEEGVRWQADISAGSVVFHRLQIVKETAEGFWVEEPYRSKPVWRSKYSKKASKTRRAALQHLFARKNSYVKHSKRRLDTAQGQLNIAQRAWEMACGQRATAPIRCVECGQVVEKERECYANPTCFKCLPPPEPLPVIPFPKKSEDK